MYDIIPFSEVFKDYRIASDSPFLACTMTVYALFRRTHPSLQSSAVVCVFSVFRHGRHFLHAHSGFTPPALKTIRVYNVYRIFSGINYTDYFVRSILHTHIVRTTVMVTLVIVSVRFPLAKTTSSVMVMVVGDDVVI